MSPEACLTPIDLARAPAFQLAGIHVRPSTREVLGGEGRRDVLEPRVMQVLVALAERRGEVVSRDDLSRRCWAGRVVSEDSISRCIAALRRLAQVYVGIGIQTIARVGYRLNEATAPDGARDLASVDGDVLLAVLPFENLASEAEMSHFCEGVTEEIIQAVARSKSLRVIGRAASSQFRGGQKIVAHVADQFRATHVLDGSVRRCGAQVRVCAHLIECRGQTILWSARFDRELSDVFAVQDLVAEAVAMALEQALAPAATAIDACGDRVGASLPPPAAEPALTS
jgi:TolB-like protein